MFRPSPTKLLDLAIIGFAGHLLPRLMAHPVPMQIPLCRRCRVRWRGARSLERLTLALLGMYGVADVALHGHWGGAWENLLILPVMTVPLVAGFVDNAVRQRVLSASKYDPDHVWVSDVAPAAVEVFCDEEAPSSTLASGPRTTIS